MVLLAATGVAVVTVAPATAMVPSDTAGPPSATGTAAPGRAGAAPAVLAPRTAPAPREAPAPRTAPAPREAPDAQAPVRAGAAPRLPAARLPVPRTSDAGEQAAARALAAPAEGGRSIAARAAAAPAAPIAAVQAAAPAAAASVKRATARVVRPTVGVVTSHYGPRWGRMHAGVDFGAATGTPVRAVMDGLVVAAAVRGGYGLQVAVQHPGGTTTTYSHLSRMLVRSGPVRAGQVIGLVGSTGRSTGPHLHFEVRPGARPVDPVAWLRARGVRL